MDTVSFNVIAHIYNDFTEKFGIPRQSAFLENTISRIVFEKEYAVRDALRGIEDYSHLWLLWHFSQNSSTGWSPCVRPPRLGGNKKVGVFATRSPYRPSPIGLSSVKLVGIEENSKEGLVLVVTGADILSGTPILDIKPYIPYSDSHPHASGSFAEEHKDYSLEVIFPDPLLSKLPKELHETVLSMLRCDPRPSYQHDSDRVYGMRYGKFDVHFTVKDKVLTVTDVT